MAASEDPGSSSALEAFPSPARAKLSEQVRAVVLSVLVLTVLTGCIFPLLLGAVARTLFPRKANGSLVSRADGIIAGSELIAQEFTQPKYFQPRPSAAGNGYDATASGATNLGPNNPKLKDGAPGFAGIQQLAEEYRKRNGLAPDAPIPIDAVTRSASGLDPDISPENAVLQAPRVARARGGNLAAVLQLVRDHTKGPQLGLLGAVRVSVLELNVALDEAFQRPGAHGTDRD